MDIPRIKNYCLEELRREDNKGIWLDIYYRILKRNGQSYGKARADFFKQRRKQLRLNFKKD